MKTTDAKRARRSAFVLMYGDKDGLLKFIYSPINGDMAKRLHALNEFTMFARVIMKRVGEIDDARG